MADRSAQGMRRQRRQRARLPSGLGGEGCVGSRAGWPSGLAVRLRLRAPLGDSMRKRSCSGAVTVHIAEATLYRASELAHSYDAASTVSRTSGGVRSKDSQITYGGGYISEAATGGPTTRTATRVVCFGTWLGSLPRSHWPARSSYKLR